jgi:hypothetical protein
VPAEMSTCVKNGEPSCMTSLAGGKLPGGRRSDTL